MSAGPTAGPGSPASPPPGGTGRAPEGRPPEEMTVGELVFEVSDRATVLVREEIELAKTEVTEKVNRLLQGGAAAAVAGVFLIGALILIMHGVAWLLNDLFFNDDVWAGFLIEAVVFLIVAAVGGFLAYKAFQKASPPTPDMAIEEAKEIKTALESEGTS
jgi:uncharacterized membrane protein YqjE